MDLLKIATKIAKSTILDSVNSDLAKANNVDHVRSILGQHKIKLFKEPAYPDDIPETKDDLEHGIESINDIPVDSMMFLKKSIHGWKIEKA